MDASEQAGSPNSLVLCKFANSTKLGAMLSLTVNTDLTWKMTYHDKALSTATTSTLEGMPLVFSKLSDVVEVVEMLDGSHTCVGNADIHLSRHIFMDQTGIRAHNWK